MGTTFYSSNREMIEIRQTAQTAYNWFLGRGWNRQWPPLFRFRVSRINRAIESPTGEDSHTPGQSWSGGRRSR